MNGNVEVYHNNTFERTWKNSRTNPPKEAGRYWCLIEEQGDLGLSRYQWNCYFAEHTNRWIDDGKEYKVIYWTELAPIPSILAVNAF